MADTSHCPPLFQNTIQALKIQIQALKIRIQALKIRIQALKIRIQALKVRIQALKIRIQALKIRIQAFKLRDPVIISTVIITTVKHVILFVNTRTGSDNHALKS